MGFGGKVQPAPHLSHPHHLAKKDLRLSYRSEFHAEESVDGVC